MCKGRLIAGVLIGGLVCVPYASMAYGAKTISLLADPCTEVCEFNLCVAGPLLSEVHICSDSCQANLRVWVPSKLENPAGPVQRVLPGKVKVKVGGTRVRLVCSPDTRPCQPCDTDAECDDQKSGTLDLCLSGACAHVCG